MTTTLIPTEDQTQLMLESPMTTSEKLQKKQLEATASGAARTRANCLLEIYQDKLFRGDEGGRSFGDYLTAPDGAIKLGYSDFNTDKATLEMMWAQLCDAIEEWNEANELRDPLPLPASRSYMHGWQLLFNREHAKGAKGYAPFTGIGAALKIWKTAVFKSGENHPTQAVCRETARNAKALGEAREPLSPMTLANPENRLDTNQAVNGNSTPEPVYEQRTTSAADRMQAAADKAAREQRQAAVRAEEQSLREDGIDPRLISTMEKESDFDAMNECETYSVQLGKLHQDLQTLEVWVRGRLNQYGSVGMDHLRSLDAGLYTISGDIKTLCGYRDRLDSLIELLGDDIEPGDLTPAYSQEPTN